MRASCNLKKEWGGFSAYDGFISRTQRSIWRQIHLYLQKVPEFHALLRWKAATFAAFYTRVKASGGAAQGRARFSAGGRGRREPDRGDKTLPTTASKSPG